MYSRLKFDIAWSDLIWTAFGAPASQTRIESARATIQETFGSGHLVMGLSVRTIFDAMLKEVSLPAGAAVLMSGINIQNMGDIVEANGLRIEAVDIGGDTLVPEAGAMIAAQAVTQAKMCIVTQLFGAANAFADVQALRRRGVFVVEDAAQAFAGKFHLGLQDVDVSLFSFGPIKRRTALGGGVAVFRDAVLAERVNRRLQEYPKLGEWWFRRRALKYLLLKAATTPWIYALVMRAIAASGKDPDAVIGSTARGFAGKALFQAIKHRPPLRMTVLMARQIAAAPDVSTRRRICEEFVGNLPQSARVGTDVHGSAHWLLPILPDEPLNFITRLRASGFDATRGATSLKALVPERTERARELISNVVYVPNPADLSAKARRKLTEAVLAALAEAN